MSILGGLGISSALDFAGGILDRVWPKESSMEEKMTAVAAIAPLIQDRDGELVSHQKDIILSEMSQGDNYTKRARPTVVYAGLAFMGIVNVLVPTIVKLIIVVKLMFVTDPAIAESIKLSVIELSALADMKLPTEFWVAWSSVVGIWAIGRSAEKRGVANKLVSMITGNK